MLVLLWYQALETPHCTKECDSDFASARPGESRLRSVFFRSIQTSKNSLHSRFCFDYFKHVRFIGEDNNKDPNLAATLRDALLDTSRVLRSQWPRQSGTLVRILKKRSLPFNNEIDHFGDAGQAEEVDESTEEIKRYLDERRVLNHLEWEVSN
jgi:hypothetical protein